MLPNSAVTVAHGQLLVATHYDFLTKILDAELPNREQLVNSIELSAGPRRTDQLAAGKLLCARTFSRTDEEYRAVYELIRSRPHARGRIAAGQAAQRVLGEGKEGVPRAQRIDGSKLPDYEAVRRYFGPAGIWGTSEPNGWFLTGFTLSKDAGNRPAGWPVHRPWRQPRLPVRRISRRTRLAVGFRPRPWSGYHSETVSAAGFGRAGPFRVAGERGATVNLDPERMLPIAARAHVVQQRRHVGRARGSSVAAAAP